MSEWKPINTAPVGPLVLVSNENTGRVVPAYGYWNDRVPFPLWCSVDPEGMGRFKPTHWMPLPEPPKSQVQTEEVA